MVVAGRAFDMPVLDNWHEYKIYSIIPIPAKSNAQTAKSAQKW